MHAGLLAATADYVAFMDGDGSFDPADLVPMLADVHEGRADLAVGRRRPVSSRVWPWHARAGNALIVAWLRRRIGMTAHDIAPIRVCRRDKLLALDVQDRRFGYPVELLQKATLAGWRLAERDVAYHPRAARHPVEGVRVGRRHGADRARLLDGAALVRVLVVAKAPVAGLVKTRLGAVVGPDAAADSPRRPCSTRSMRRRRPWVLRVATCRSPATSPSAVRGAEITDLLAGWTVTAQRGEGFAARLAAAHLDAGPGPVAQIGMDTPQVTARDSRPRSSSISPRWTPCSGRPATAAGGCSAGATRRPRRRWRDVAMSEPTTYADTWAALEARGQRVATTGLAARRRHRRRCRGGGAQRRPHTRFAQAWRAVARVAS